MKTSAPAKKRAAPRAPRARGVQIGPLVANAMVLQGAVTVFAQHGVRAASVEHLLEASGISRRTFYRLFTGKEDVVLALYKLGTDRLLDACRRAVADEPEPLRKVERCIDAHLDNARDLGRLVFVLGGEAQRHESALHATRMSAHAALAALLQPAVDELAGASVDPLLIRGLLLALEGVARMTLEEGDQGRDVSAAALARTRRVMIRMATGALAGAGARVAPWPHAPRARRPHEGA